MTPDQIAAIGAAFAPVAAKIGEGAQYGWQIVMQQQIVTAWISVFWAFIGFVLLCFTPYFFKKWMKTESYSDARLGWGMLVVIGFAAGSIMFCAGSITAIEHFLNPGYYALQFFLSLGHSAN